MTGAQNVNCNGNNLSSNTITNEMLMKMIPSMFCERSLQPYQLDLIKPCHVVIDKIPTTDDILNKLAALGPGLNLSPSPAKQAMQQQPPNAGTKQLPMFSPEQVAALSPSPLGVAAAKALSLPSPPAAPVVKGDQDSVELEKAPTSQEPVKAGPSLTKVANMEAFFQRSIDLA